MGQRLKGQDTEILFVVDGVTADTITTIKSFEMEWKLENLDEGFLGETTNRKDSIFNGVSFSSELQIENAGILGLVQQLLDKARRRTPGLKINIKTTLNFPNGDRPRIIIQDAEFGGVPLSLGGRGEYAKMTLQGEASEARVIS